LQGFCCVANYVFSHIIEGFEFLLLDGDRGALLQCSGERQVSVHCGGQAS
jgi:hypothetical protein